MTDKDEKIRQAYNQLAAPYTGNPNSVYDVIMMQQNIIKLLSDLYEAGRVEGELSKIKEDN